MSHGIRADERGLSNMVGAILVVAIFVVAASGVWVTFQTTTSTHSQEAQVAAVSDDFETVAGAIETVGMGQSPTRVVSVSTSARGAPGQTTVQQDRGHIRVDVTGVGGTELDAPLGSVVFRRDGATVAVQGGGVWRASTDTAPSMVTAPPISATATGTGKSVTLSVLQLRGSGSITDTARITAAGATEEYSPVYVPASSALAITIESEYAKAWAQYFRNEFPASSTTVQYSGGRTPTVTLTYDPGEGFYLHFVRHTVSIADQ